MANPAHTAAADAAPLLLGIWREVCRHLEIDESVQRIAPLVASVLPIDRLVVRRIDLARTRLETVATGDLGPGTAQQRTDLDAEDLQRLVAVCRHRMPIVADAGLREVIAPDLDRTVVVGPLTEDGRPVGLLLLSGPDDLARSLGLVQELLEPFAVALANDLRLHELARLREAVEADNRALLSRLQRQDISESIVGSDTGLRGVMDLVEQVAPTDAPVLVLGETGSGKEVVARAIHARSRRAHAPFLRVNCGAIPSELVDSELFGHERGSFTGAVATRKGWFERADGGTLFLDEIGELPLAAQVRLLRVLQDGSFERVGAQRSLNADVRIVAATHRDMTTLVEQGQFRQDLWYRISVFPVRLPPLRERTTDIALLAAHFANRAGMRLHGVPLAPTPTDIDRLLGYDWPGNVRELAAVIERAAILGDGHRLDVGRALGTPSESRRTPAPAPVRNAASLEDTMKKAIEEALNTTRGRIEGPYGAAARLGINPHTLRSRMRKLGIEWSRFRGGT